MQEIPDIKIEDYAYPLTDDRIAKYPLAERDASKLLRYKAGEVDEWIFRELPALLPEGSLMVFNETKVVPARLHFTRESGAHIEIFCLEPVDPVEYRQCKALEGGYSFPLPARRGPRRGLGAGSEGGTRRTGRSHRHRPILLARRASVLARSGNLRYHSHSALPQPRIRGD